MIEAKKLAFEDRARFYADPKFADVPVERLIAKDYAATRRALIDRERCAVAPSHGRVGAGDTVYLAAADAAGNMVSLIQSNYMGFGSGVTVVPFGFGLQNRGSQFALDPAHANVYAPGKRPFHTIIPAFATRDGEARLAFGVMGAAMQPQGQVQVLSNMVDFGMDLQAAGDAPRVRHEGSTEPTGAPQLPGGGTVYLEPGFDAAIAGLRARGHRVERRRRQRRVRRLPSDPARPAHRRVSRRFRVAQGWARRRVLKGGRLREGRGGEGVSGQKRSPCSEIVGGERFR